MTTSNRVGRVGTRSSFLWAWAIVATVALVVLWQLPRWVDTPFDLGESADFELPRPLPDKLVLQAASFEDLPGFEDDEVGKALPALRRSCSRFRFLGPQRSIRPEELGGTVADWLPLCDPILDDPVLARDGGSLAAQSERLRLVLRQHARPVKVLNNNRSSGLFTGYYEPILQGSRQRTPRYRYPLYRHPRDIVSVDLGPFRDEFEGKRISGRWDGKTLRPYYDREEIAAGALGRRGLELLWVDDPVDSFFLHIQGSGRIELAGGGTARVGYAGQNGHSYYAIGRELVVRDGVDPKTVSMQSIRAWLEDHPEQADEVMNTNASYVFFRELKGQGPLGSQGVPLEPGRSLAVDRRHHPMGAPVWLDAEAPALDPEAPAQTLQRLLVAQDTGGAIRGPIRGDVFWGGGDDAAEIAGRMKHSGQMWLLYPLALAERVLSERGLARDAEASD